MRIIIIGNGIAGTNAARYIRKYSDHKITMISGETDYPYSRTALMYIYMGHMTFEHTKLYEDGFWAKNRIDRIKAWVQSIDSQAHSIQLDDGRVLLYDKLILATGSSSNRFAWPGANLKGVQGLYNIQDLESIESATSTIKHAVIVGGGLIGIELAEMFHSRHIPVTFLVWETSYWNMVLPAEESLMINEEIRRNGIDLKLGQVIEEIIDDGRDKVAGVITSEGEKIDAQFVAIAIGVSPNIKFLQDSGLNLNRGILVDPYLQTSIEDIYAVGDCAEHDTPLAGRKKIEAVWYTGRMMGQTVAHTICKSPIKYDPGIWYNSAKFFNIEYQVYGDIPSMPTEGVSSVFWKNEAGNKSIRINYRTEDQIVTGFNLLGIRYRHEVCEKWIQSNATIEEVLKNLSLADFDPEFYPEYSSEVIKMYEKSTGKKIVLQSKRNLNLVTRFLQNSFN